MQMPKLLPDEKQQGTDVLENFLEDLSDLNLYREITGYQKLPETDQSFSLNTHRGDILLQLTEVVEGDYTFPKSKAAYDSGMYIHKGLGVEDWVVDIRRRDTSIQRSIQKKIEKHCSKSKHNMLWLLIFSRSAYLQTEYCERGTSKTSVALVLARDYLSSLEHVVFDQIWYSNHMTRPVQIWPLKKLIW